VAFDFFEDLVRAVLVFILNIEDGIDEVFVLQKPEAILPAEACEHRAVVESSLAVQVELRGPPSGGAVFKLGPEAWKLLPTRWVPYVEKYSISRLPGSSR